MNLYLSQNVALLFLVSLSVSTVVLGKVERLFVFGDSNVDTGNTPSTEYPWQVPYGVTFPRRPTGRWSDGLVITDYIARFLGLATPIPYEDRKNWTHNRLSSGINFAYGGAGVFETLYLYPNVSRQITFFEQLIRDGVYKPGSFASSVALVAVSGNDYAKFMYDNSPAAPARWREFIAKVVEEIISSVERVQSFGFKVIGVNSVSPLGCLPYITKPIGNLKCVRIFNRRARYHNELLKEGLAKLSNKTAETKYVYIDMYDAFLAAKKKMEDESRACCDGVRTDKFCGDVDDNGVPAYTVCKDPSKFFYWDGAHPGQEGWKEVYVHLRPTLDALL